MTELKLVERTPVRPDWVDYNGHMRDAGFAIAFDEAAKMIEHYLDLPDLRPELGDRLLKTEESHLTYVREVKLGENLDIFAQLLAYEGGQTHAMLTMKNAAGEVVAYYEAVLASSAAILKNLDQNSQARVGMRLKSLVANHAALDLPAEAGRRIALKNKPPQS